MNRPILRTLVVLSVGQGPLAANAGTFEIPRAIPNEINVTSDSKPGWIPTAEQMDAALKIVQTFLDAEETGRYAEAYSLQTDRAKQGQTLAQFSELSEKFRAQAGPLKFWRVLKVTWTKDPAQAPSPGTYAAVDLAGQFANVDRDCGYIVVYQPPSGGAFAIMRRENNYLDNNTANKIEQTRSKAELSMIWAQVSRNCPNYSG